MNKGIWLKNHQLCGIISLWLFGKGTYNFTSMETPQEKQPFQQIHDVECLDDRDFHEVPDEEEDDATTERDEDVHQRRTTEGLEQRNDAEDLDDILEVTTVQRSGLRRTTTTSRNIQGKEEKRPNRGARIEEIMVRFLETREEEAALMVKQAEEESAHRAKQTEQEDARLAREKEAAKSNDFAIKRCISVLNKLEVTKEEKAKAYVVFIKSKENRETFISGCEEDVESTLIWLRNEMV